MRYEEYNEQYQYFLAVALALLLLDVFVMSRRNPRLRRFNIFREE
jgi:Ca-activated chloride channel family protein